MINKIEQPYEFLIRIKENEVSGAIVRRLEKFVESGTGEVISEKELEPVEISLTSEEINMIKARL